jgi:glycosyltransferase involved in cell wall biosynthesis
VKIIQVPFCYAPDPIGGTEVYVATLAKKLQQQGIDVVIAAPSGQNRDYLVDGIRVRRFEINPSPSLSELYGRGDARAAAAFAEIIDQEKPSLVHLHAFTAAVSVQLIRAAKSRNVPIVFTYHTPTASCQRGTMMRWGSEICDGKLIPQRCAACTLNGLGVPRRIAEYFAKVPPRIGDRIAKMGFQKALSTAVQMNSLLELRLSAFRELAAEADHFVAVCDWVREVMVVNGVPRTRITLSRQGIEWERVQSAPARTGRNALKIAFFGRFDSTKGLHVLIKTIRALPNLNLILDIYGIVQSGHNDTYRRRVRRLASDDARICFKEPLLHVDTVRKMAEYDFVAIPSLWLETGPLVALEAFAAGVPVIGWNAGGLAELVQNEKNGLLIASPHEEAWARVLTQLSEDPHL